MTDREWLENHSRVYPILDPYQREGFHALMGIADKYRGAFLCDGVGLGKTYIGLMVIEHLIERQRRRVTLFVPKAARKPVWEQALRRYLPHIFGDFSNLVIFNHTDLLRGNEFPERLKRVREMADAVVIDFVQHRQIELWSTEPDEEPDEDIVPDEMIEAAEELSRDEYKVDEMVNETIDDLYQLAEFLEEMKKFKPSHDDKLKGLIKLLKTDPVLKKHKVLIFTEYMATARYLKQQLEAAGIPGVDEVDSASQRDRGEVIRQFAPYYNGASSADLAAEGLDETRVLISTDVLSEGLNLQDATRLNALPGRVFSGKAHPSMELS